MSARGTLRVILGLIVAALWLPVLLYVFSRGWEKTFSFFIVALYTVTVTVLIATPLVYFLRRKLTLGRCLATGFVLGTLGALTFWSPYSPKAMFNWGPLLMAVGVISSLLFWVTGVWGNRDLHKVTSVGSARPRAVKL